MANLMKNDSYYIIYGWMLNELKLKSNELCIFAVIYAISGMTKPNIKCMLRHKSAATTWSEK